MPFGNVKSFEECSLMTGGSFLETMVFVFAVVPQSVIKPRTAVHQ